MSRKTRQEKIIADLRRKLELTQRVKWEASREKTTGKPTPITYSRLTTHDSSPSLVPVSLIKKDLTKTGVLTILAISLEIVLYFLFRGGKI